jgi:hypothetical protein
MSPIRQKFALALALAALASRLAAWQDPFSGWNASAYAQVLELNRPAGGQPGGQALDDQGDAAGGYKQDGPYLRKIEPKLWGPLGWDGWDLTLGVQTDLVNTTISDLYAQWKTGLGSLLLKMGQERMPFGIEQQISASRLVTIERSLIYGFENYGHVANWGLSMLAERGWGLRADLVQPLAGPLGLNLQAGAFDAAGSYFNPAVAGVARGALALGFGPLALEGGFSFFASRANLGVPSDHYAPLGAVNEDPSLWESAAGSGGKATVLSWGPDLSANWGCLHGRAEMAQQSLGPLTRGGGETTLWCELPSWESRRPSLYAKFEQAWTAFGDGIHRPGSLYRGRTFGISCPLPYKASLKLESLQIYGDDFQAGFSDGQVYQAQMQFEL